MEMKTKKFGPKILQTDFALIFKTYDIILILYFFFYDKVSVFNKLITNKL